ncbi:hypothetical protein [Streptomyces sp. NPDC058745]|uniref:hypothetical protein n=1 Tax=Streptomyces sp. NPDC058745 TaxID=3346621 RepID=UPI0036A4B217
MRLRNALALGVTAATAGTAVLALAVLPAAAEPGAGPGPSPRSDSGPGPEAEQRDQPPTCGKATDTEFPLDTRIHSGPADYAPGGAPATWNIDLTNTTTEACDGIHPVLVLADRHRMLQPAQIRLDFYDAAARRWRPVPFEGTEEHENIGVLTGFPGFAVPAGGTVTVPVRLAFRADTAPDEVVANAAIVQRRGDDGDWVGESEAYRLTIDPAAPSAEPGRAEPGTPVPAPATATPSRGAARPSTAPGELALTGRDVVAILAPVAGALVLGGAVLVLVARRGRRPRRGVPRR